MKTQLLYATSAIRADDSKRFESRAYTLAVFPIMLLETPLTVETTGIYFTDDTGGCFCRVLMFNSDR